MDSRNQSAQNENILTHPENLGKGLKSISMPPKGLKSISMPPEFTTGNKSTILTDEEVEKCEEWEMLEFEPRVWTGNDQLKFEREQTEKSIKEEVDMMMLGMHQWTNYVVLSGIHQLWGNGTSEDEFIDDWDPIPENLFGAFELEDESDH